MNRLFKASISVFCISVLGFILLISISNCKAQEQLNIELQEEAEARQQETIHDVEAPPVPVDPKEEAWKTAKSHPLTITPSSGVYNYNGFEETWYGDEAGRHYMTDQMRCDDQGCWRFWDGGVWCFVVAIKGVDHWQHVTISMGEAIVLDTPENYGVVDLYVHGWGN